MTNGPDSDTHGSDPRNSTEALAVRLGELRSNGATILECIKYVKLNQGCSLAEAKDIVVNSSTWADRKVEFLRHQQEMFEEFLDCARDRIESIEQTITPEGTKTTVRMRMLPNRER